MLPRTCLHLQGCMQTTPRPCAFKEMWFSDLPLSIPTETADSSLAVTIRSASSMYRFMRNQFFDILVAKLQIVLLLRAHCINLKLFKYIYRSKLDLIISLKTEASNKLKFIPSSKAVPPSLENLPTEIRLRIFEHLTEDTSMRVVGHRYNGRDAFWFKDRGKLLCILVFRTC